MSEKRYVISELDPISVLDMNTGDTFPIADGSGFVETIVECLNVLHEENKQLQHDATILIQANQDYRKENEQLKQQLLENTCDNCIYSKAIYADVECRKKGLTKWECNCDEFKGDVE